MASHSRLRNNFVQHTLYEVIRGAGASTKLVDKEKGIERLFNYKFPLEYNKHFEIMLEKKKQIFEFYKR